MTIRRLGIAVWTLPWLAAALWSAPGPARGDVTIVRVACSLVIRHVSPRAERAYVAKLDRTLKPDDSLRCKTPGHIWYRFVGRRATVEIGPKDWYPIPRLPNSAETARMADLKDARQIEIGGRLAFVKPDESVALLPYRGLLQRNQDLAARAAIVNAISVYHLGAGSEPSLSAFYWAGVKRSDAKMDHLGVYGVSVPAVGRPPRR